MYPTHPRAARMPRATVFPPNSHINWARPEHMPFSPSNKRAFTAKYLAFITVGVGLPFFASWYQLRKSGGTA